MNSIQKNIYSVEDLPYIYHSECRITNWRTQRRGFYVLPNGDKYVYDNPKGFNLYNIESELPNDIANGDETNLKITPDLLFENLDMCTKKNGLLSFFRSKKLLEQHILDDLLESEVISYPKDLKFNRGSLFPYYRISFSSLLIYDVELQLYKRILLTASGDRKASNQSEHRSDLVWKFGTTR
jgi:hypothetical protein